MIVVSKKERRTWISAAILKQRVLKHLSLGSLSIGISRGKYVAIEYFDGIVANQLLIIYQGQPREVTKQNLSDPANEL
jgi:hypothetical protein